MITSESKTSLSQGSNDVHHLGPVNRFVSERELGRVMTLYIFARVFLFV